jgi:hypothetical protein
VKEKKNCVNMCQDLHVRFERNPKFLSKITTGDEMWVYGYDLETKQQSQQKSPSSPRQKKTRKVHSNMKSMLTVSSPFKELCIMNLFLKDKL